MYRRFGKRLFDLLVTIPALVVLAPLLLVLYFISLIKIGYPVFFRQERPGKNNRTFHLVKFRSMRNDRGPDGELLPDEQRITRYGKFLRASSLDEIPELWNVLVGQMSLVGPRPLLQLYLDRHGADTSRRHEVLPGITGWAQVNGRNEIGYEERFVLDTWYVENMSLWLDIKILLKTLKDVVNKVGVTPDGHHDQKLEPKKND